MSTHTSNRFNLTSLPLPYTDDASDYFLRIRHLPYAIWLDSGRPSGNFGRYDIISAAPQKILSEQLTTTTNSPNVQAATQIFDELDAALEEFGHPASASDLPFTGGAIGYLGYNMGSAIEPSVGSKQRDIALPDAWFGIYNWAIIIDHPSSTATLTFTDHCSTSLRSEVSDALRSETFNPLNKFSCEPPQGELTKGDYLQQINRIQHYIEAGDCYQVNFAQRFKTAFQGDPLALYLYTRKRLPSPYSCYLELEGNAVLSFSPEQFLTADKSRVETKPIKGTAPRKKEIKDDELSAQILLSSSKDRAENIMIVDLLRNDLSKHCEPHSVNTPQIASLESYANVHHLVSRVTGILKPNCNHTQVLRDCFPGGSITGAPKIRAMQIINECEPVERSIYCGSIGYLSSNGKMDTNIAIRTMVLCEGDVYFWGGGGIVADSDADAEYQETLDKVSPLFEALTYFSNKN
ncbi:aminodeoxychorismate synthase component I [Aurantivibrio plasticivorans]